MLTFVFRFPRKQAQVCFTEAVREDRCSEPAQRLLIQITRLMPAHHSCQFVSIFWEEIQFLPRCDVHQGLASIPVMKNPGATGLLRPPESASMVY